MNQLHSSSGSSNSNAVLAKTAVISAWVLGASAALVAVSRLHAEWRHPPTGKFLEVEGVRLHYLEEGFGSPVILLHGNGAMATDFQGSGLFNALAENHRVIAFDCPGFGYSDRPHARDWSAREHARLLLKAFVKLGVSDPLIVAHSWGALCAMALAVEHEQKISGLVLVNGYFYPTFRSDSVLASGPAIPVLGDVMRHTLSPLFGKATINKGLKTLFAPADVPATFRQAVPESLLLRPAQLKARAAESSSMSRDTATLSEHYSKLQLPITLIADSSDEIANAQDQSIRLHQAISHSSLKVFQGLGHMLHYFANDNIVEAVRAQLGDEEELFAMPENIDTAQTVS